ncbi:proline--tRNA ligase [Oscillochloris sp. ZM17-4]|uniref:proline--tRNA ligase n=1 Tax=Oscillochloris sp. ZM17-4 TaxID=2866714 RepID=UPI001C734D85|nr:proline--tRNA ligase [Oscillochloris sp. ZM17-4]MBX0330369.1 proline--tRNA ligase [Oscillochloris sp. ZM17-4]
MRLSNMLGRTLRDAPAEAEHAGHQLAMRAGLARPIAPGSYALLPLGMAVARRIEAIMHAEMARAGGQEFRTPIVQPAALWEATGRYQEYGPLMLRASDRAGRPLVVAPTHEEAVAELARREVGSYRQLPALIYQIHTKYRDEMRTKGGLMRLREFTMLDAYSLDADEAGLDKSYDAVAVAFERTLERCGVAYAAVEAGAGEMGGGEAREYMALSPSGEDTLARCAGCGYAANVEVAVSGGRALGVGSRGLGAGAMEEIATPNTATIADLAALLGVPESATAKAVFFDTPDRGLIFAVIRGDLEVSEEKLRAAARVSELRPASAEQIAAAGAVAGYASPVGLIVSEGGSPGVLVVADPSVAEGAGGLVAGANRAGYHLRNVVYGRDWRATAVADIAAVRAGDPCARCGAPLALDRGVEIGHIFKLGDRYTRAVGATYLDEAGAARPVVMGSYGIGVERLMQIIIEQHHDEAGIIWPASVAPADVHLMALGKGESPKAAAEELIGELEAAGLRVLYDDRGESAGVKFNDADLIGLPLRLVVSDRLLAAGELELKPRGGAAVKVPRADLLRAARNMLGAPA